MDSTTSDGETVYAWFATGQLVALDLRGELVWERHLARDYGPFEIVWGHSSSPTVYGDLLILRGARWDEMDTQARVWAVPVARMKMKRDHRVPLCGRAMGDPDAAQTLGDDAGPLVFSGRRGRPLACLFRAKLTLHSGIVWPKSFQISELEDIDAGSWLVFRL